MMQTMAHDDRYTADDMNTSNKMVYGVYTVVDFGVWVDVPLITPVGQPEKRSNYHQFNKYG